MKYLFLFETFIDFTEDKNKSEKKVSNKIDTIYEDDNLSIKVVKSLEASKCISDPQWCSTNSYGFYKHNLSSNLYRFIFKDGYKLRLTWDYLDWDHKSYSDGTHWGQGGTINGDKAYYLHIRPRDEKNPFEFDYNRDDDRKYMVDKIEGIPQKARDAVYKYQDQHKSEKNDLYLKLYKEIEKIKVINITNVKNDVYRIDYSVTLTYLGNKFKVIAYVYPGDRSFSFTLYGSDFEKYFKNRYAFMEEKTINNYLSDKAIEWIKKNDNKEYLKIKSGVPLKDNPYVYIEDQTDE